MRTKAEIPLRWPSDEAAREQMRQFNADLDDARTVQQEFVAAYREDVDGDGHPWRDDLAVVAQARMRLWGDGEDAVACALKLFQWLCVHVLPTAVPHVAVPRVGGTEDARLVAHALVPHVESARNRWHAAYSINEHNAKREWALMEVAESSFNAARSLSWIPGRMSPKRFKAKVRSGDSPRDQCERVAAYCACAHGYASELSPELAHRLLRLADLGYEDAGVARRGRQALSDSGVVTFGPRLEALARVVVTAYDAAAVGKRGSSATVTTAIESIGSLEPEDAVAMVAESPELARRPIPRDAPTFAEAAVDVVLRAAVEVAAHVHAGAARR